VGLTHVVPDMLVWWNQTGNYLTNGPINNLADQAVNLGNWEPNISVLGDSTFLIEANTFANDQTLLNQNNIVILQPTAGGAPKISYAFSTDAGVPFKGQLNLTRQNGNPGRVAGDKRVGAVNYLTAAEPRWGNCRNSSPTAAGITIRSTGDRRYVSTQPFSLNPSTLVSTPWPRRGICLRTIRRPPTRSTPGISRTGGSGEVGQWQLRDRAA
jgi:hypothetical protein